MKLNSIKFIVISLIFVLGIITMFIFTFFSYHNVKDNLENKFHNESDLVLKHTLLSFQNLFKNTETMLDLLSETDEIMSINSLKENDDLNLTLDSFQKLLPNSKIIHIGMEDGSSYMGQNLKTPDSYDPRKQEWYRNAKKNTEQIIWTEPYLDYMTQSIIITASKAIMDPNDDFIGVIAADFLVSDISHLISNSRIGEEGYVLLISNNGTVIANRDNYMIGDQLLEKDFQEIINNSSVGFDYNIKNNKYHLHIKTFDQNNMILVTAISYKEINDNVYEAYMPVLTIGIICLFVFGILAYFIAIKGILPIERLARLMKKAEDGNYNVYSEIDEYDEINSLSNSFNNMIYSIRKRDNELKAYNKELAITRDELKKKYIELEKSQEELKENEEKIKYLAYNDSLTGLSNRESLLQVLENIILENRKSSKKGSILFIDLDNFKRINDTMGHTTGDKVLVEIATRLNKATYLDKIVARIGGDEFIIVLHNINTIDIIEDICRSIIDSVTEPVVIDTRSFILTASIGVALFPFHGIEVEDLMKKADMAMYKAKDNGKNCYRIFDESMQWEIINRVNIENGLREALQNNEFELHYQPQYNVNDNSLFGLEALLRWKSPKLGEVAPLEFIKVAEESGLIVDIEKWVLENACKFIKIINNKGFNIRISINISGVHLMESNFVESVFNIINKVDVDPKLVGIEITETVMVQSFDSNKKKLDKFKGMGINIYLDDFGKGYSSLNYLQNLPIDYMKIDKAFIDNITNSERNGKITETIVELAHNIGLRVIAEGVEYKQQLDLLTEYNCDIAQGYYYSKPISKRKIIELLESYRLTP